MNKVLVTGAAGFIGYHLCEHLIEHGYEVVWLDSINDYYNQDLKKSRLKNLGVNELADVNNKYTSANFIFYYTDLINKEFLFRIFEDEKFDCVVNLAAQAGVRHSLVDPYVYVDSNVSGFLHILEASKNFGIKHLLFASSSSVYGLDEGVPFSENKGANHPKSLYAATKRANELMAHSYAHLFNLPCTGLRFFTVYGPWGRPDMALFLFADGILNDKPIQVFGEGQMVRDFTYVKDVVTSIEKLLVKTPSKKDSFDHKNPVPDESSAPYQMFNIGNNSPVLLMKYIQTLEDYLDKKAVIEYGPVHKGDVVKTYANVDKLANYIGYKPGTSIEEGIKNFVDWYLIYRNKFDQ